MDRPQTVFGVLLKQDETSTRWPQTSDKQRLKSSPFGYGDVRSFRGCLSTVERNQWTPTKRMLY